MLGQLVHSLLTACRNARRNARPNARRNARRTSGRPSRSTKLRRGAGPGGDARTRGAHHQDR